MPWRTRRGMADRVGFRTGKDALTLKPPVCFIHRLLAGARTWFCAAARGARSMASPATASLAIAVLAASIGAAAEIALPRPQDSAKITVRAGQANWWQEGEYQVWVLRGDCEIMQANLTARSEEAVVWIKRPDAWNNHVGFVLAYLEGDVTVESSYAGAAHRPPNRSPDTVRANRWFGRFFTSTEIHVQAPSTAFEPAVKPAIYHRGQQTHEAEGSGAVQQAQYSPRLPGWVPPAPPSPPGVPWSPPSAMPWPSPGTAGVPLPGSPYEALPAPPPDDAAAMRRIAIRSRSNVRMQGKVFPSPDGSETVAVITSGVNVVVSGIQNMPGLGDGKIDIETDRIVIWTARLDALDLSGQSTGEKLQPKDAPLEFYLEGNIVFRQGDRVIYAERMYYNVRQQQGIVLNAEILTPAPGYQGLIRLKAEVLQQLDQYNFRAVNGAVTSSRIGVPRYWLQAGEVSFQDIQIPRRDPLTGQFAVDPETGEPAVEHQYLATSRNNFLFLTGLPVLYWPVMATDLVKPNYYLDSLRLKHDNVFGTQVMADWDLYQLLGIRAPPEGTEWTLSTDYLSERGPALGTRLRYDRDGCLAVPGHVRGDFDAWGIYDEGDDDLGRDRLDLEPTTETRGRVFWQHRHELAAGYQLTVEAGWISDNNFLEQYFEQEWDERKDQITGLELKRYLANSSWSITADARLNDFFTQSERLPRFDHFLIGQDVLNLFTWHAHSNVGYERLRTATLPPPPNEPAQASLPWEWDGVTPYDKREGIVAATRQELSLPLPLGPVKLAPYVLGELAHWHQDINATEVTRAYGQAGIRGSLPFWSVNSQVQSPLWNLNGLAHKVVLDADFFWADANQEFTQLPLYSPLDDDATEHFQRRFIQDLYGGTAGLPLTFSAQHYALRSGLQNQVTAPTTEIADDLAVAQIGLRQRWQTKRGQPGQERIIDWMKLDIQGSVFPKQDRDNFGEPLGLVNYDFSWHVGDRFSVLSDGFFDFFTDGLQTASVGTMLTRPLRGDVYVGFRAVEGPFSARLLNAAVNYRMSEKWILNAGGVIDFGETGSIGERIGITRIGESLLVRIGINVDHSRDNVGAFFAVEPRFLPGRLSSTGGVPIPPVGAFGLE
jgi:lipopolysaccharide export system protein LptA